MKKRLTETEQDNITYLAGGTMLYFESDKQFIYFIKEQTPDLIKKMQFARKSPTPMMIYPYEVIVSVLRKIITTENIGKYYKEEYLRFSGTSEQFLLKYFDQPYYTRHTKTKGTMTVADFVVKTWLRYYGNKKNTSVFALAKGTEDLKEESEVKV